MSKYDKFKAVFLPNKKLGKNLKVRVKTALDGLDQATDIADELPDNERAAAKKRIEAIEKSVLEQVTIGADKPGQAWIALEPLQERVDKEIATLKLVRQQTQTGDAKQGFASLLGATRQQLAAAGKACRAISPKKPKTQKKLSDELTELTNKVDITAKAGPAQLDQLRIHNTAAKDLLARARSAAGRPKKPSTEAAVSKAVVNDLEEIPAFGDRLASDKQDAQGRTAKEDATERLAVFDTLFAADTDDEDDPDAERRNQAMRLAAVTSVAASRAGADLNDPYLVPRIGQSMVTEYTPELKASLSKGNDDEEETESAVRLAQALVMDDPVGKLMLGKLNPADAVQRIRDMAEVGDVDPSMMLKLLRQQFEMKMGSLTVGQVKAGKKDKDKDAHGNFELSEITGELSPGQFDSMFTTTGTGDDDTIARKTTGSGLEFKAAAGQLHKTVKKDTFGTLAQTYLGDAERWTEIRDANQVIVERPDATKGKEQVEQTTLLKGKGKDDPLPVGLTLTVPGKLSLLDQLEPYVAAWDTPDDNDEPDKAGARKPKKPKKKLEDDDDDEETTSPLSRITAKELREGAAKLRSPRDLDPSYIQAPGLGQDHKMRKPLGEEAKLKGDKRKDAEEEKLHGQINDRQYAHLRMLARADAEDRDTVLAKTGKTVEDNVLEKLKARYGIDDNKAKNIASKVQQWISNVPLTITFTGDKLFSDPTKNSPTYGEKYKSEVELSRGKEDKKDVIGRDEQGSGTMGTQGGSKTVTGWKERGDNYMRWRRDKDSREGRKDDLSYDNQQIYGAANPTFAAAKGDGNLGDGNKTFGTNYYGDAHFLLKDSVRNRCAFIVRTESGRLNVQRQDISMLVYDMITQSDGYAKFMDAMLQMASGAKTITSPGLTWEVHLMGGFDSSKDAKAIYLSSDVSEDAAGRIRKYAKKHGMSCENIGAKPVGLEIKNRVKPEEIDLSSF